MMDSSQAVTVDERGALRSVRESIDGSLIIRLESSDDPEVAFKSIQEAYASVSSLLLAPLSLAPAARTSLGPVLIINELRDRKRVPPLLQALADSIAAAGISGFLRADRLERVGPGGYHDYACLTAAFSPIGSQWLRPAPGGRDRLVGDLKWRIESGSFERILRHALDWCVVEGGKSYFEMGMHCFSCRPEDRRELVSTAYRATGQASIISFEGLQMVRKVDFSEDGYVLYQQHDGSLSLHAAVQGLTEVLTDLADEIQYGLIKSAYWNNSHFGPLLDYKWPEFEGPHAFARYAHPVLDRYVHDACGVQILGPNHNRSLFPPEWQLTPVGTDRILAVHPDFNGWFGEDHPNAELVASGREHLHEILFTRTLGKDLVAATFPADS
jgi:hypothetical protein